MKRDRDKLMELLPFYLRGEMSESEAKDFEAKAAAFSDLGDIRGTQAVWQALTQLPEYEPGPSLRPRFYAMMEAYKAGQRTAPGRRSWSHMFVEHLERWWPRRFVYQFATALAFLLLGFLAGLSMRAGDGRQIALLRSELYGLREMVATSLLQSQSSSERLRGVNYSYAIDRPGHEMVRTLAEVLNYDPNLNVRLAAADALAQFYDADLAREGLLQSLRHQTSPFLQVAIIGILEEKRERNSIRVLQELQNRENIDQVVKSRAGQAIERLY